MSVYEIPVYQLMHRWAEDHLEAGQEFDKRTVIDWFAANYPNVKRSTVTTHLQAMSTNVESRTHHSTVRPENGKDLFFKTGTSSFRLYDPEIDPAPIYRENDRDLQETEDLDDAPDGMIEETASVEFAYEAHLRDYLVRNLEVIEPGLHPFLPEFNRSTEVDAGGRRIDILARDKAGTLVVIELKVSKGYDRVVGQLLRYVGWVRKNLADGQDVRGLIVASEISKDLLLATSELGNVGLFEYQISFALRPVGPIAENGTL